MGQHADRSIVRSDDWPAGVLIGADARGDVGLFATTIEGWTRWRARRLPLTAIDRVRDGARVKIVGRVDGDARLLEAPISGRACVAWSVEVQEAPVWETVLVASDAQDFTLRDGSGRPAIVRAASARVLLAPDETAWPLRATARMLALQRRYRLREGGISNSLRPYRYCEAAIEPGDTITVVGVARIELDPSGTSGSYRESPLRVQLAAAPRRPLWILDGDGP